MSPKKKSLAKMKLKFQLERDGQGPLHPSPSSTASPVLGHSFHEFRIYTGPDCNDLDDLPESGKGLPNLIPIEDLESEVNSDSSDSDSEPSDLESDEKYLSRKWSHICEKSLTTLDCAWGWSCRGS